MAAIQGSHRSSPQYQHQHQRRPVGLKMSAEEKETDDRRCREERDRRRATTSAAGTLSAGGSRAADEEAPSHGPPGNRPATYLASPVASIADAMKLASPFEIIPCYDRFGFLVYVYKSQEPRPRHRRRSAGGSPVADEEAPFLSKKIPTVPEIFPADFLKKLQKWAAQAHRDASAGAKAEAGTALDNGKGRLQVCTVLLVRYVGSYCFEPYYG